MPKWWLNILICVGAVSVAGCCLNRGADDDCAGNYCREEPLAPSQCRELLKIEEPSLACCNYDPWMDGAAPSAIDEAAISPEQSKSMTLQECVNMAMRNSRVMRDLGGTVLRTPQLVHTVYGPSLAYTDPLFGEESALSDFDAQLEARALFENNDRLVNSTIVGNTGVFNQDLHTYQWGINKRSATGALFALRHITDYDANNNPAQLFPRGAFDTYIDAEVRQPLFQGAGSQFNRIAGPNAQPGQINGVLIGRVRADTSLSEFEIGIQKLVSNVENAYWDLYFAYRDLAAKMDARDEALLTWRDISTKINQGIGSADEEHQAREQYYRFESEVIDALNGRLIDTTRTNNGSSGGTFRNNGGVRVAERRLRLIMGAQINDGQLIRPVDLPNSAPVRFDWESSKADAIASRPELRKQRWMVKQRELELLANKNFLKPRLDAIARYRWRGLDEDLFGQTSATNALFEDGRQEWQLGVEFSVPLGYRKAHAAVRNSELRLARDRALLQEQERHVIYGLSNNFGEVKRAYEVMKTQYNRLIAVDQQVSALEAKRNQGHSVPLDILLEAQRRRVDTRIRFHQSEVEYALALKNVHFEKGTLLIYNNVVLSEAMWSTKAYQDADRRDAHKGQPMEKIKRDATVSANCLTCQ